MPTPSNDSRTGAVWAALGLAALTLWVFSPGLAGLSTHVFGDIQTDALRGAWGFNHIGQALASGEVPWQSTRINFPAGAQLLVLPLASGLMLSPLGLLDPILSWNLSLIILAFASAMGTAWLAKLMTDSWLVGVFAGALLLAQPMLHHALADGTPEHLSLWAVPLFIGAAWTALHEQSPRWGIGAGFLSIVVALDSPYHAIYALILGAIVLPFAMRTVKGRERDLGRAVGAMTVAAGLGIWVVWELYSGFEGADSSSTSPAVLQGTNATDLKLWWRHMGMDGGIRDFSRPPTLMPNVLLTISLLLCVVAGRRGTTWLVAGLLMLGLSFGTRQNVPTLLGAWLGGPAEIMGASIIKLNTWIYSLPIASEMRFPRRWLVPGAMSLAVGASIGLSQILQRWLRRPVIAAFVVFVGALVVVKIGLNTSRLHTPFPHHTVPTIAFADAIADSEDAGAVLLLPSSRAVEAGATRDKLPVFADLDRSLASADSLYLQMRHGRPTVSYPSLQTLTATDQDEDVARVLRDWSDLAVADAPGRGIPPSAYDPGVKFQRDKGFRKLRQAGLRWIAVDQDAYTEEGLALLKDQLGNKVLDEQTFSEGTGVLLLELSPAPVLSSADE